MTTLKVRDSAQLGLAVRDARLSAGLSQADLAAEAGIGRQWLVAFEAGDKPSAPFDMVMGLLRALDLEVTLHPTLPQRRPTVDLAFTPNASDVLISYQQQPS